MSWKQRTINIWVCSSLSPCRAKTRSRCMHMTPRALLLVECKSMDYFGHQSCKASALRATRLRAYAGANNMCDDWLALRLGEADGPRRIGCLVSTYGYSVGRM